MTTTVNTDRTAAVERLYAYYENQGPYRCALGMDPNSPLAATARMHLVSDRKILSLAKVGCVESDDFVYMYSMEYLDEELGTNTLNLAIPGETVKDAYYLLKDACESNDVKTVIMDVDYQYWMDEQPQGYFTEPFICQNITNLKVKTEYLLDNWDTIDLRNVLVRRLSWDCTWSSVKQNVSTKMTEAYREYSIEAAGVDGKVEGADGPYIGKGFFYRDTFGGKPGGADYIDLWVGRDNAGVDVNVSEQFGWINDYCKENGIELICVTSPIAPAAMQKLGMGKVHDTLQKAFDELGLKYYDFNKALMSFVPRDDIHYGDLEGHMGGALGNTYSEALAKLLKDAQDGEIQESDYFYASFDEMYQTMKSDYTKATGLEWEGY